MHLLVQSEQSLLLLLLLLLPPLLLLLLVRPPPLLRSQEPLSTARLTRTPTVMQLKQPEPILMPLSRMTPQIVASVAGALAVVRPNAPRPAPPPTQHRQRRLLTTTLRLLLPLVLLLPAAAQSKP